MPGSASAIRGLSLERWIGLPAARVRCVRHLLGIAATLAAAKVLLATIGVTLFVAEQGAAGLPLFYIGFAAIAILLSFGLSAIIDRAPKVRLAQLIFTGLLLGTAALRLPLALEVPGVSFALLASATAFEIALDIVFWVVVAAYLDAFEFRRATPLVYMALALGGAAGGALARVGAGAMRPADLLLLLLPLAALVVVQLGTVARRLHELPDHHHDTAPDVVRGLSPLRLGRLLGRHPLALLIALNALVVTLLYGLSEFLILSIYEAQFASEAELAAFLALLFALMQLVEFVLLITLTRLLLERAGPLWRNLVFPLSSLAGLAFFVVRPRLAAAVVLHVNIEALSNALFLPIHNANFVALPLAVQGRARTLSEGICYPIGLALAGAMLWRVDPAAALLQVEFAALMFAALCALLSAGVGLLFLPTLRAHVGAGPIPPGRATNSTQPKPEAARVRALLRSREPALPQIGLALARQLEPAALEGDLLALATHPDHTTRIALARLIAEAPRSWAQPYLDRCLAEDDAAAHKLALLVMLRRRAPPRPEQMARISSTRDPAVLLLGHLAARGLGARPAIEPLLCRPGVADELVDAVVGAGRGDCLPLLVDCLETASPAQQHAALVMLSARADPADAALLDRLRRLARGRDPAVRTEAIALLGRARPRAAALRDLVAALDDADGRVRRRAAEALGRHGDRAAALLRHRLVPVTLASVEAAWALARIGTPRARRLLAAHLGRLDADARRTLRLLEEIARAPDHERWSALDVGLRDHQARLIEAALAALASAIDARLAGRVRYALRGADQRRRASAFELLAAGPASRRTPDATALLRLLLFEAGSRAGPQRGSGSESQAAILDQAMASLGPWVRRAAALVAVRSSSRSPSGERRDMDDQELERILALKRTPLFRYLPLEIVAEVARAAPARTCVAGEVVIAACASRQDLLILEAGVLAIEAPATATRLSAPACYGEVALAGAPMPWPTITAVEDARVAFLSATLFEELARAHPEMALELCQLLARRLTACEGTSQTRGPRQNCP